MTADEGPCRGIYARFAYVAAEGKCMAFNYGGCRGNQNNFFSLADCQSTCLGTMSSTRRSRARF